MNVFYETWYASPVFITEISVLIWCHNAATKEIIGLSVGKKPSIPSDSKYQMPINFNSIREIFCKQYVALANLIGKYLNICTDFWIMCKDTYKHLIWIRSWKHTKSVLIFHSIFSIRFIRVNTGITWITIRIDPENYVSSSSSRLPALPLGILRYWIPKRWFFGQ